MSVSVRSDRERIFQFTIFLLAKMTFRSVAFAAIEPFATSTYYWYFLLSYDLHHPSRLPRVRCS
jgi:hypothetical protein